MPSGRRNKGGGGNNSKQHAHHSGSASASNAIKSPPPPYSSSSSQQGNKGGVAVSPDFSPDCPICLQVMRDPKVLHCGHNLCAECVKNSLREVMKAAATTVPPPPHGPPPGLYPHVPHLPPPMQLQCPVCKRVTEVRGGLAGIPTNYVLKETLDKMRSYFKTQPSNQSTSSTAAAHTSSSLSTGGATGNGPSNTTSAGGGMNKSNSSTTPASATTYFPSTTICDECEKVAPVAEMFGCTSPTCATSRRSRITYESYDEELTLWSYKRLCSLCACRTHRDHILQEMSELAKEREVVKLVGEAKRVEDQLDAMCVKMGGVAAIATTTSTISPAAASSASSGVGQAAGLFGNLFAKVREEYKRKLHQIAATLKEPTCPLSSCAVEAQHHRLREIVKRAESFFDEELLREVAESFRTRLHEVYLEDRETRARRRGRPRTVRAIRKCTAGQPTELSFDVGQIIINVYEVDNEGWLTGTLDNGRSGLVPASFVEDYNDYHHHDGGDDDHVGGGSSDMIEGGNVLAEEAVQMQQH